MSYPFATNHALRDPATGDIAIRTIFHPDIFPDNVWLVATSGAGAKNVGAAYVEGWEDLYVPEA